MVAIQRTCKTFSTNLRKDEEGNPVPLEDIDSVGIETIRLVVDLLEIIGKIPELEQLLKKLKGIVLI